MYIYYNLFEIESRFFISNIHIIPYPQCNMVSIFSIQVYHFIHLMRILANFWWLN